MKWSDTICLFGKTGQKGRRGRVTRRAIAKDLKQEIQKLRDKGAEQVWLGGQSYGGRQSSMLAAEEPGLVDRLLLLSYPLHAPGKPEQLRTAHFPKLTTPVLFVHGSRDPFGTLEEMRSAIQLIPAPVELMEAEGVGHDLGRNHAALGAEDRGSMVGDAPVIVVDEQREDSERHPH